MMSDMMHFYRVRLFSLLTLLLLTPNCHAEALFTVADGKVFDLSHFHQLIRSESWDQLESLPTDQSLEKLINSRGMFGRTAIHIAKSADMMRWLLERGAKPAATNDFGDSALLLMVQQNRSDIVKVLLEYGADPAQTNAFGNTPLREAQWRKNAEISRLLEKSLQSNQVLPYFVK